MDSTSSQELDGIDLSDSYVLGWDQNESNLIFSIEASIWPTSEHYSEPSSNEYTCYKTAKLSFLNTTSITGLLPQASVPSTLDLNGTRDYGNIESLTCTETGFEVTGDFGIVSITGGTISFQICT